MSKTAAIALVVILLSIFMVGTDMNKNNFAFERSQMVEIQLKARGIESQQVLKVMQRTPRELFMPKNIRKYAYEDSPLGIGYGQTISQPYIVAFMTEAAKLTHDSKVLEIGTGSGYQAAILSQLSKEVYTIEIVKELGELAEKEFAELGYTNIHTHIGDGHKGWPEAAPFDVIIVTAAAEELPQALVEQLKDGGRLIIPIGTFNQELMRITRTKNGLRQERLLPVRFVPMVK
jgi:protein-L-isoaspartate(D-aspartate) O-methyltransferase